MRTISNGIQALRPLDPVGSGARRLVGIVAGVVIVAAAVIGIAAPPAHAVSGGAVPPTQLISTATAECPALPGGCAATTLGTGQVLTVTFNEAPAVGSNFNLSLTDGTDQGTIDSSNAIAVVAGSTVTYTLTGAPNLQTGNHLSLATLEILSQSGVTAQSDGAPWNLIVSGEVDKNGTQCTPVHQRVFGGTNCSIGFGGAGPTAPDVFDAIAVPTADLPGPPMDNAPEVITNCQAGSADLAYSLTGAVLLGQQACGVFPAGESGIGNTTSNTLDYIPTPGLVSYMEVGVVEQVPGSLYVSGTDAPPQYTSITVSGDTATFNYDAPVVCQGPGAAQTVSQFTYASPWWSTSRTSLVYPSSVACPGNSTTTSIQVTYPGPIPTTGVRFKFEGFGDGFFIIGAPGSPLVGEREASQSAYVGTTPSPPNPTIAQFTGPLAPLPSSGGSTSVTLATLNATQCSVSAAPSAGVQISIPYTPAPAIPPPESTVPCPAASVSATVTVPPNTTAAPQTYILTATASGLIGSAPASQALSIVVLPGAVVPPPPSGGYDLVASDGGIFTFGPAFFGSEGGMHLNQPVVGMAMTSDNNGYWLVARDGGIFTFGTAGWHGSVPQVASIANAVGMAADKATGGYWVVGADGSVYAFNAPNFGGKGGQHLNRPVVGMAATPDGMGYQLVASDGGIFSFGDAQFHGSMGGQHLNQPIVGMATDPSGQGYWEVASDGGIFSFDAQFHGSMGGQHLNQPIVGMAAAPGGIGYYLVASDGGIFSFDAPFHGSKGGQHLNQPIVGMAATS
jgi:hypothetical protein